MDRISGMDMTNISQDPSDVQEPGCNGKQALLHEDITSEVLAACFEVINDLGSGFLESVYEKALLLALQERGVEAKSQVPLEVKFRGHIVGVFTADILVSDKVIIELKAVKALTAEHQAQTINYLKATGIAVALLVNFGNPRLEYRRLYG